MITLRPARLGAVVLAMVMALVVAALPLRLQRGAAALAANGAGGAADGMVAGLDGEQVTCPADMIAYWRFDETTGSTFSDSIQGIDATCTGESCPAFAGGRVNGALDFDIASGTQVTAAHHAEFEWLGSDSFSLELWVKPDACNDDVFFGKYSVGASWWLGCEAEGGVAAFSLRDTELQNGVRIRGTASIVDGNWHHLVGLREATTSKNRLYVDGELVASETVNYVGGFGNEEMLTFGYHDVKYFATATIDEVAVYGRVLAADEIAKHYDEGLAGRDYCNTHPIAMNGSYATNVSVSVDVPLVYSDLDGPGPYVTEIVEGPDHGTLSGSGSNRTYTPEAGFEGSDSFRWQVSDGLNDSNVANVTILVLEGGDALYLPFVAHRH